MNGDIEIAAFLIAAGLVIGAMIIGVSLMIAAGRLRKQ
jgi:hypothetical protein